ncbi:MAG TPA: TetR/AcrR family transcriptional regulator [Solirubrobacteraceae bacterium]|nr:TetR/AcrR family transcriptional regulator [Solirubrobacteraceae bacterium]
MAGSERKRGSSGQSGRKAEPGGDRQRADPPRGGAQRADGRIRKSPNQSTRKRKKTTASGITPLYTRLPKGPHKIEPGEVAHHQRIRMHGAMIEAISSHGYEKTTVMLVIALAGVSRRAFYEQFSGKDECFSETYDLIVNRAIQRLAHAYRTATGDPQKRMRSAIDVFMGEFEQNPNALRLVLVDSHHAGPDGALRLHRTTAMCEGLFASAFSDRRLPDALPVPVVRGIVGGLRRVAFMRLRDREIEDLTALGREMLKWLAAFRSPAIGELRPRSCANPPFANPITLDPTACGGQGRRAKLLRSAIETGVREPKFDEVSSLRIADQANLPVEAFMELYRDPHACYLEALDVLGDELLQLVANPNLVSEEWAPAVCATVEELLVHLSDSPARLLTLAGKALDAGPLTNANVIDLAYEIATLLTEGAPRRPRCRIAVEGIAGGLWHILSGEVLAGRSHRLPVLSEYVSYLVLSPFIGAEEAVHAIVCSRGALAAATPVGHAATTTNGIATINGAPHWAVPVATNVVVPAPHMNGAAPVAEMNGTAPAAETNGAQPATETNGAQPATETNGAEPAGEDYLRLAERRSAKCVNTTPTSTDSTITTISGA